MIKMRLLILIASSWALVASKPETYKEKEDFQYSRSSSDDGSKSGYYGAQRGNMGGNYERAHNMDSLAQHQMSTLVRNVDGELGEGAKTRTGSVFAAANSRGLYGSGNYDLSNLRGRNFGEGTISGDSLSQSALSQKSGYSDYSGYGNSYSAANKYSSNRAQSSGLSSGFQSSGLASQYLQTDAQKAADNIYGARNYEYDSQGANNYKYAQSSSQARSDYENSNSASLNSDHKTSSSLIYATPVRVYIRPGTRIAVPVAAQVYDTNAIQGQNTVHSDSEILDTTGQRLYYKPTNNAKHYESSYSYRKEWEKQNSIPVTVAPIESPIPTHSELYEDARLSQIANNQYESDLASAVNSHASSANSAYISGYSASNKNALSGQSQHQSQTYNSGTSALKAYNYGTSASNAFKSGASDSSAYTHNAYDAAAANLLSSSSHISDGTVNSNNLVEGIDSKPKSYHSSYSYHKSWERRGDPYIIKPVGDEQTSQRLTAASAKQGYVCTYCLDDSQQRVRRSINIDDNQQSGNLHDDTQDMGQQSINGWQQEQDLGQQAESRWQDLADLGQQTQNKWDELGSFNQQPQSQLGNLEDLGQQTQSQWDKLEDLGQQTQNLWDKSEELSQQPQTQDQLEDLGQQTQSHWGKLEDLDQKPQTQHGLENLGQQTQNQWDNLGDLNQQTQAHVGKLEDLGQQTQTQWDKLGDLNQQTQSHWGKLDDFGQKYQNNWDIHENQQTQSHWGKLEDLNQQSESKWDNLENLGQQSQHKWSYLDNLGQQENLGQQGQSQNVASFGQETQNTANGYGGYQFYEPWTVDGRFVPTYTNYREINGLPFYVQDPLQNINKRWDCHNLEHGSYFHHHNIDLKESQGATHNSDFLFNVNHLDHSGKPKQNTAQNSEDKREIDMNIQRETTTVTYVTSDEKTPKTTQKTIKTDEVQENNSSFTNIYPIDIGRGDIGPEDTLIETTNINEKKYKTPEEIESLSLTKDQRDISKEPLNLSVTSLHELNKRKNNFEQHNWVQQTQSLDQQNMEQYLEHFHKQDVARQLEPPEGQNKRQDLQSFEEQNMIQQLEFFEKHNLGQHLENIGETDIGQQFENDEQQNLGQQIQNFDQQNMEQHLEPFEEQNMEQLETNQKIVGRLQNFDKKKDRDLLDIPEEQTVRMNSQDDFGQQVEMSADKNTIQNSQASSKQFEKSPENMYIQEYKSQNVEPTKSHNDISPSIEPTTEKSGFWGSVWNKTKSAKDSVVSWFSS